MIISEKKMKRLMDMPYVDARVSKSKDGKWIIHKTTITSIKPVQYFEAVLSNDGMEEVESEDLKEQLDTAKEALKE